MPDPLVEYNCMGCGTTAPAVNTVGDGIGFPDGWYHRTSASYGAPIICCSVECCATANQKFQEVGESFSAVANVVP
jgi:hypothetical protein